jgi:predicted dehydrogenase
MIEIAPAPEMEPQLPSRARPRLGFAGTGWIGRNRLETMVGAGAAEMAAVYDPSPAAVEAALRSGAGAVVCETFAELLAQPVDGIVIATPSALHAVQAEAALAAGKAVFCQKPLARTATETRAVLTAARAADRLLGVDLSYRAHTGMRRIRDLIAGGELGSVYAVEGAFHNAYGPDKPWFYDPKLSGGGCLLDLGIHLIDLALWCLDFPAVAVADAVLSGGGAPLTGSKVEDYAAARLVLGTGTSVQLACSWKAPAGCDARIELTFFGTKGGAVFSNLGGSFYDFKAEHLLPDRTRRALAVPPDAWSGRAAIEWCQRLALSRAFDPQIEHLAQVATTLDRLYGRV